MGGGTEAAVGADEAKENLLTDILLGGLQCRVLCQLILLAGELFLIGSGLLYAAPHEGGVWADSITTADF